MGKPEQVPLLSPTPDCLRYKYLTTWAVLMGNLTFGCAFNFISPALETLRVKYDSTVEEISFVFTVLLISYIFGAVTSGIFNSFYNRQQGVILWLGGMATCLYIIPHLSSKRLFFITGGVLGYSVGAYDAAQVVWMIELWQSKAGPYIQAQNLFYALGANIPPLLLSPFLSKTQDALSPLTPGPTETMIYVPFTIAAVFSTLAASYQLFLYNCYPYQKPPLEEAEDALSYSKQHPPPVIDTSTPVRSIPTTKKSELMSSIEVFLSHMSTESEKPLMTFRRDSKPKVSTRNGKEVLNWTRIRLVILTAMFLGLYQAMEISNMQFIPIFGQYSDLKLSESDSAFVMSGLTGAFALGRFMGIFVILKVRPQVMLVVNLALVLVGNVILLVWADSDIRMYWVGCIVLGAGFSTMYATFCAFIDKHIVFSNGVGTLNIIIGSVTASIYPLIVGGAIEFNPLVLTYTNFFSISVCILSLAVSSYLTYGNTKRMG